jgi:hypothetical protein
LRKSLWWSGKDEIESLGRIVGAYLDLAEERAKRKIPMTMEDWAKRLDLSPVLFPWIFVLL